MVQSCFEPCDWIKAVPFKIDVLSMPSIRKRKFSFFMLFVNKLRDAVGNVIGRLTFQKVEFLAIFAIVKSRVLNIHLVVLCL